MGLILSKYEETRNEAHEITVEIEQEATNSAPISTPNRLDPRSPSTNVARTPLELILAQKPSLNQTPIIKNGAPHLVFGIDPRSPTVEFQRTPIVIVENSPKRESHGKLYNKNLENVRKLLMNDEIDTKSPKKLTGTSPISTNPKRKSMVGVLETNIDFTETNIDDVLQQKLNQSLPKDTEEDCTIEPIVQVETNDSDSDDNKECLGVDITTNVKDFDKKLSTLIYEDKTSDSDEERIVDKLPKIHGNNRTPLGVRNTNSEPVKKFTKLKVNDKPTRKSRIPILKDAHYKNTVQCENTPPMTIRNGEIKTKVSKWDGDATIFI